MKISRFVLLAAALLLIVTQAGAQTVLKLTLKEARRLAVENHPQIKAASFDALAAAEITRQRESARFPRIEADVTGAGANEGATIAAGALNNSTVETRGAAGFRVSQLLFDFGRTSNLIRSARSRANAAGETASAVTAQVLLQVDRAYFSAQRTQALLRVSEHTVANRKLVLEQTQALQESGIKSGLDVRLAEYSLDEANLQLSRAQNDHRAALAELSAALGSSEEYSFELAEESLPADPLPDQAQLISEAMKNRPELKALKFNREAADYFFQAEKAVRRPSVSAVAVAGGVPIHDQDVIGHYNAAGVNIDIPIFGGGSFRARSAESGYRARSAEQQLRQEENQVARDVRIAWLAADNAYKRIGLSVQLLNHARQALELAQERYRLGLTSIVELSQAVLNVTAAEIEDAGARFDYLTQRSVLEYQSGRIHY